MKRELNTAETKVTRFSEDFKNKLSRSAYLKPIGIAFAVFLVLSILMHFGSKISGGSDEILN